MFLQFCKLRTLQSEFGFLQSLPLRFCLRFWRRNKKVLFRGEENFRFEIYRIKTGSTFCFFVNTHSYYIPPPFFADVYSFATFVNLFSFFLAMPVFPIFCLLRNNFSSTAFAFFLTRIAFLVFNQSFSFRSERISVSEPFSSFATVSTSFYSFFTPSTIFNFVFLFNDIR